MEYFGYAGTIAYVDLTTGQVRKENLDLDCAKKFLGGAGLNLRLAYDLIKPGADPLSPDNPILIGAGPLVGTLAPGSGRFSGTTKFALPASQDNRFYVASANGGGRRLGLMLKCAGYDHLVITGRASRPVYLKIIDDDIEICDANDLWGKKDTYQTTDELVARYGRCGVIAIGKAGEKLVKFALAIVDKRSTLGRNGFGAVMGSKNLKAICVRGTKGVKIKDPKRFMKEVDRLYGISK